MSIVLTLSAIAILALVLNIILIQSNNIIFIILKRPNVWILFMGLISFVYFLIGSRFHNSFNIVSLSAFLAFIANIPPKAKMSQTDGQKKINESIEKTYEEMGIKKGRLKYRVGLFVYVLGGILGWLLFYGKIVTRS